MSNMQTLHESHRKINDVEMPMFFLEHPKSTKKIEKFMHYHSYLEFLYLRDGHLIYIVNGERFELNKGDMIVVNSYETHTGYTLPGDFSQELVLLAEPSVLTIDNGYPYDFKYLIPLTMINISNNRIFRNDVTKGTFIESAFLNGIQECNNGNYGFEIAMKAEILKIFLWTIRQLQTPINKPFDLGKQFTLLEPALKCAQNNLASVTAKTASQVCNLDYSYFSKLFKKVFGKSFTEYITDLRINRAKTLLITTHKSITDISMELGFSSSSHFIKTFKQYTDETPLHFAKKNMYNDII